MFPIIHKYTNKPSKEIQTQEWNELGEKINQAITTGEIIYSTIYNKEINRRFTQIIKRASEDHVGIFLMDITELYNAVEKAEAANRLKSAFLANMSHEIRTPLNAIIGFSELILSSSDEAEHREFSKIIETNSEILLNMINDILDLSKIEAGYIDLKHANFDVAELFHELNVLFTPRTQIRSEERRVGKEC